MNTGLRVVTLNQSKEPPKELCIWKFGNVNTVKGTFVFSKDDAKEVMSRYNERNADLCFDYDHAAIRKDKSDGDGRAAAWFKLKLASDGLYATDIKWTEAALNGIKAKEWRYWSPAFLHDEGGHIRQLINIALTNIPATHNLEPLVAASYAKLGVEGKSMENEEAGGGLGNTRVQINDLEKKIMDLHKLIEALEDKVNASAAPAEEAAEDVPGAEPQPGEVPETAGDEEPEMASEEEAPADDGLADQVPGKDDKPAAKEDDFGKAAKMSLAKLAIHVTGAKTDAGAKIGLVALGKSMERVKELEASLAHYESAERQSLLSQGTAEGKILPSQKPWAERLTSDELRSYLKHTPGRNMLPKKPQLHPAGQKLGGKNVDIGGGKMVSLNSADLQAIELNGYEEAEYARAKAQE